MSGLRRLSLLLILFSVLAAGGCAKVRRGLDWARYENRVSLFVTPLYRIPSGFSSSYHRHLYGDERIIGEGEQVETIPMYKGSGAFFPSDVNVDGYDPTTGDGPEIIRPTIPVGKRNPGIQQALDFHRRNLLR